MIEIFKTNVRQKRISKMLLKALLEQFPARKINFDLDDCDKILRVEGRDFCPHRIIALLTLNGHYCE
ncbi:hypothetical protein QN344_06655, partial [Mucilaginibacter sp. 5B2]|nr:hypothetical protein [Mucilaginibacter sp. 5B2]